MLADQVAMEAVPSKRGPFALNNATWIIAQAVRTLTIMIEGW